MSELTAYNSVRIYWAVEQVEDEAGDIDTLHLDDNLFYLKSDVDKKIAELQSKVTLASLAEDCSNLRNKRCNYCSALQHHKYKRCVAMAKWCQSCRFAWSFIPEDDIVHKSDYFKKWEKRWLELAEKFK